MNSQELIYRNFWGCYSYVEEVRKLLHSVNMPPEHYPLLQKMFEESVEELEFACKKLMVEIKKGK